MTKIDIVVGGCRSVDLYSAKHAVPCLDIEIRVIPISTILSSTLAVSQGVTRSNRTLSDAGKAIHIVSPILANAIEVKTSAIVF